MMMLVCLLRQKFKKLRFQMIDDKRKNANAEKVGGKTYFTWLKLGITRRETTFL